jgi:hypothetical protein
MARDGVGWAGWPVVVHSARTALAAVASFLVARLFRLQEAYWAPITTVVITQSSLGAAWKISWQRFFWNGDRGRGWRDRGEPVRGELSLVRG